MMCFSKNNGQLSPSEYPNTVYTCLVFGVISVFSPSNYEWCLMSYVLQIEFISGTKKSAQSSDSSGTAGRWLCWPCETASECPAGAMFVVVSCSLKSVSNCMCDFAVTDFSCRCHRQTLKDYHDWHVRTYTVYARLEVISMKSWFWSW